MDKLKNMGLGWDVLLIGFLFAVVIGVVADVQYTRGVDAGRAEVVSEIEEQLRQKIPTSDSYTLATCLNWLYGED